MNLENTYIIRDNKIMKVNIFLNKEDESEGGNSTCDFFQFITCKNYYKISGHIAFYSEIKKIDEDNDNNLISFFITEYDHMKLLQNIYKHGIKEISFSSRNSGFNEIQEKQINSLKIYFSERLTFLANEKYKPEEKEEKKVEEEEEDDEIAMWKKQDEEEERMYKEEYDKEENKTLYFKNSNLEIITLFFDVSYSQKDIAKKLGCIWCKENKKWYLDFHTLKSEKKMFSDKMFIKYVILQYIKSGMYDFNLDNILFSFSKKKSRIKDCKENLLALKRMIWETYRKKQEIEHQKKFTKN